MVLSTVAGEFPVVHGSSLAIRGRAIDLPPRLDSDNFPLRPRAGVPHEAIQVRERRRSRRCGPKVVALRPVLGIHQVRAAAALAAEGVGAAGCDAVQSVRARGSADVGAARRFPDRHVDAAAVLHTRIAASFRDPPAGGERVNEKCWG